MRSVAPKRGMRIRQGPVPDPCRLALPDADRRSRDGPRHARPPPGFHQERPAPDHGASPCVTVEHHDQPTAVIKADAEPVPAEHPPRARSRHKEAVVAPLVVEPRRARCARSVDRPGEIERRPRGIVHRGRASDLNPREMGPRQAGAQAEAARAAAAGLREVQLQQAAGLPEAEGCPVDGQRGRADARRCCCQQDRPRGAAR